MSVCSSFLILQRKEWKLGEVKALRLAGCLGNGSKSDIQCSQLGVRRPQAGFAGTIVLLKATAVRDRGQWCVQLQSISPLLQRGQRTSPGMTPCQEGLLRSEWNPSRPAPLRSDIGMVGWVSVGSQGLKGKLGKVKTCPSGPREGVSSTTASSSPLSVLWASKI